MNEGDTMKRFVWAATALCLLAASPAFAQGGSSRDDWTGNAKLLVGTKKLKSSDWAPLDEQGEAGLVIDFRNVSWPFSVVLSERYSADEATILGTKTTVVTAETRAGLQLSTTVMPVLEPYVAAGPVLIAVIEEVGSVDDNDVGFGYWAGAGVNLHLGERFLVGLDWSVSKADVTLFGVSGEAGGTHVGITLGLHF
jgi:opacity protein-like surface antigen